MVKTLTQTKVKPVTIALVLYDDMLATSLSLPVEMLRTGEALALKQDKNNAPLAIQMVAETLAPVSTRAIIRLRPEADVEHAQMPDFAFIPSLWRNPRPLIKKHPKLDLRLRMISCGDPVTSLNLDMFINDQPIEHVSYECEKLKIETYHVVASPEVAKSLTDCSPQDWGKKAKFIDIQDVDVWDIWCEKHTLAIESRETQYFSHTILMLQAALSGQGLVLLGESLIQKELATGQLVKVVDLPVSFDDEGFYFLWHKRRKHDPNVRLVKNWLYGLLKP